MGNGFSFWLGLVVLYILCSCSTAPHSPRPFILLSQVEKLKIGKDTGEQVQKIVGIPDVKLPYKGEEEMEVWDYFEGETRATPRLALGFSKTSGLLKMATWNLKQEDQDTSLDKIQNRFKKCDFKRYDATWTNPHSGPDYEFFEDPGNGLQIVFSNTHQRVKSITWRLPNDRSVSSHIEK